MKPLYAVLVLTFLFASCKKEKSKEELLQGDWKLTAMTIDPPQDVGGAIITDLYAQQEDCEKDNIYSFYENQTYKVDEGVSKCNSADPQTTSGNWGFLNDDSELQIIKLNDTIIYNIIDLDENIFKVDYSERDNNNVLHTLTATFEPL